MAKKKMFKTISTAKFENMGATGAWSPIAYFEKQQKSFTSAYIDKVRVSFILEGDESESTSKQVGFLWATSTATSLSSTDSDNTGLIISASASRGGGGVVTLPINRRIVDNSFDSDSGNNAVSLQCRMTDTGTDTYAITMIIETWGRWHKVSTA